jgi:hypothetical protein
MWPFNKKREPVEAFWAWFAEHAEELRAAPPPDATIRAVGEKLQAIHPGLVFEVEVRAEPRLFVVSAEGDRELFPIVLDVVRRAPEIAGWRVAAFRQPGPIDVSIKMGPLALGADDIWFTAQREGDRTALVLHVRGADGEHAELIERAVLILLDNALGEYLMATAIGGLDLQPLPADPEAAGLQRFAAIREALGPARDAQLH